METKGKFNDAEIDYAQEYCEARRLMGIKGTDLDQLHSTVAHLYLQCPEDMSTAYQSLLLEISARQSMLAGIDPFTGEKLEVPNDEA